MHTYLYIYTCIHTQTDIHMYTCLYSCMHADIHAYSQAYKHLHLHTTYMHTFRHTWDEGSILGRIIPKTQKWYLIQPRLTLSIIRYGSRVKWNNPGKTVAPTHIPRCSSYWKGSRRLLTLFLTYIYTWLHVRICT